MRTISDLFPYQQKAVNFQCSHNESALWLSMGLGKTPITLTSIVHLLATKYLSGALVIAPVRVCRLVWRQEALKWQHTRHLKFSVMTGSPDQRLRALLTKADVYLINYENLGWLAKVLNQYFYSKGVPLPFDGVVYDELSKLKNSSTHRVKEMLKILPAFKWRTGLTGTPASNGYRDLHGQFLVLDGGARLGTSKTHFVNSWYKKDGPFKLTPMAGAQDKIKHLIGDITLEMSAEDYNPLPDMIPNDVTVELPDEIREKYDAMERDFFVKLDSGSEVEVFNQASLTNKLLQFANGCIYPIAGVPIWEAVHSAKLDALEELIDEAAGDPILLAYAYRSDATRIIEKFAKLKPINLSDCKSEASLNAAMSRWKAGNCPLMIGHPASMGHGIDGLQEGGNTIAWYGLNWSLDLYDQFNARIRRQGYGKPPICHRILCENTFDQAQVLALDEKATTQSDLRRAIKEYRQMRENA